MSHKSLQPFCIAKLFLQLVSFAATTQFPHLTVVLDCVKVFWQSQREFRLFKIGLLSVFASVQPSYLFTQHNILGIVAKLRLQVLLLMS